jgi:hypothetical protein
MSDEQAMPEPSANVADAGKVPNDLEDGRERDAGAPPSDELDEYGHHVVDGVSVSGPNSPGYHDPDAARLASPEFEADAVRVSAGANAGHPAQADYDATREPAGAADGAEGEQRFMIDEDEHTEGAAGPTGERA